MIYPQFFAQVLILLFFLNIFLVFLYYFQLIIFAFQTFCSSTDNFIFTLSNLYAIFLPISLHNTKSHHNIILHYNYICYCPFFNFSYKYLHKKWKWFSQKEWKKNHNMYIYNMMGMSKYMQNINHLKIYD
jgi:energy-coupling factor transporter transmembrane protein EcfT